MRRRHPKKDVEKALQLAEAAGWEVIPKRSGHWWGIAQCGFGCRAPIISTPRSPGDHAKNIKKAIDRCPHGGNR